MRPQRGKQKLFDAAMKLFESQGYFATTVEQITSEAGVSKGLVYNYFKSKEELLVGMLEDATSRMQSVAQPLASMGSLEESLATFVSGYCAFLQKERRFLKLTLALMLMPELSSVVKAPQQRRAALLLRATSAWLAAAKVPRPKSKARLLLAMLDGVALHYLFTYESYPLASMKSQIIGAAKQICAGTGNE